MEGPHSMNKLSADATSLYKKLFPFSMYLILAIFYALCMVAMYQVGEFDIWFFLVPVCMAVLAYFIMQDGMIGLADDVFDCGEYLLIRNKGKETQIHLSDVVDFEYSYLTHPQLICFSYKKSRSSYKTLKFSPDTDQQSPHPDILDLIKRIDAAKK